MGHEEAVKAEALQLFPEQRQGFTAIGGAALGGEGLDGLEGDNLGHGGKLIPLLAAINRGVLRAIYPAGRGRTIRRTGRAIRQKTVTHNKG
ncbi:hypothetical protein GCM10007417_02120 [Glycocaulis alkaliphilus]|nr:hypothetical protein GCM10007417_02120 [Glycocaulis alkaliphilus]